MKRKYTLRKNNQLMTTVKISIHFSKEEVDWVVEKFKCSEAQAIKKMTDSSIAAFYRATNTWVVYQNELYSYDMDTELEKVYGPENVFISKQ